MIDAVRYVDDLPDLMTWDDYELVDQNRRIRVRLTLTEEGLEVLGDSPYPHVLEQLLAALDPAVVEMKLCG